MMEKLREKTSSSCFHILGLMEIRVFEWSSLTTGSHVDGCCLVSLGSFSCRTGLNAMTKIFAKLHESMFRIYFGDHSYNYCFWIYVT